MKRLLTYYVLLIVMLLVAANVISFFFTTIMPYAPVIIGVMVVLVIGKFLLSRKRTF